MHPRIAEVLDFLDGSRAALLAALDDVPAELRAPRPDASRWSIAQVVAHLAIVETGITALFRQRVTEATAPDTDTSPILATIDVPRLLDRERALVAGERLQPADAPDFDDALARLGRMRETLRQAIIRADGRALGAIVAPHPLLGSLNLYQWLVFLGAHESRHTAQIIETAARLAAR
jgi:hypothetical protein